MLTNTFIAQHIFLLKSKINLYFQNGQVIEVKDRSDTHISGGAQSSSSTDYYGSSSSSSSVAISSRISVVQNIWINFDDGREECIQLADFNVQARTGQPVTVISSNRQGTKQYLFIAFYNRTTHNLFYKTSTWTDLLYGGSRKTLVVLACCGLGVILSFIFIFLLFGIFQLLNLLSNPSFMLFLAVVFVPPFLSFLIINILWRSSTKKVHDQLLNHLKNSLN